MDGWTDGGTVIPARKDARTHLKRDKKSISLKKDPRRYQMAKLKSFDLILKTGRGHVGESEGKGMGRGKVNAEIGG